MHFLPKAVLACIPMCALLLSCSSPPKPAIVAPSKPAAAETERPAAKAAQDAPQTEPVVPPEIVQLKGLQVLGELKLLTMGNDAGEYSLSCSTKARGCESPSPAKNYLLINNRTHWKLPGATTYIDLAFIQNWTVTYNKGENVGLVPQDNTSGFQLGLYMLNEWKPRSR